MAIKCVRPTAEIFLGLSFFTFAFNSIVLPQIVQQKVCTNNYNATICSRLKYHPDIENDVQSIAASWMSVLPLSALVPSLFTILMIGPIADVIGKKRTMILPAAIYFIQSLIFITLAGIEDKFSPGYFLLGYFVTGLIGANAGYALLPQAYISSITTREDRTVRTAILESALFFGSLLAAISSGLMLSNFGFIGAFMTTAIVNFLNLMYVIFLLPPEYELAPCPEHVVKSEQTTKLKSEYKEKEQVSKRTSYQSESREHVGEGEKYSYQNEDKDLVMEGETLWGKVNPIACLKRISKAICKGERRNRISAIFVLFAIGLFINMGEVFMGILFFKHSPLNLGFKGIGNLIALQYFLRSLGLIAIPYICQVIFKFKDIHIVIVGFCSQICFFITLGFSTTRLMLYLSQFLSIPLSIHFAVLRSMLSKLVNPDEYGAATSALGVVDVSSCIITSLISNLVYSATVRIFTGLAMVLLGIVAIPGLIGSVIFSCVYKDREILSEEQKRLLGSVRGEEDTEFNIS